MMDLFAGGDLGRRGFRRGRAVLGIPEPFTGVRPRREGIQLFLHRIHLVDQRRKLAAQRSTDASTGSGQPPAGVPYRGKALASSLVLAIASACAGMPTTGTAGGHIRVTTELAPTRARAPMVMAPRICAPEPTMTPAQGRMTLDVDLRLEDPRMALCRPA